MKTNTCFSKEACHTIFLRLMSAGHDSHDNIADIISQNLNFSTFSRAATKAGLIPTLKNQKSLTVVVPDDRAFAALDQSKLKKVMDDTPRLKQIVLNHLFNGILTDEILMVSDGMKIMSLGGGEYTIETRDGVSQLAWKMNDDNIKESRIVRIIPATNGIILIVDNVLV